MSRLMRMFMLWCGLLALGSAAEVHAGLTGPKGDSPESKRATVRAEREEILAKLYEQHPEAREKIEKAAGYATFNNKNLNVILLSAGHGYGVAVDRKTGHETFMAMGSVGGGLGMGAKSMRVVFIFQQPEVLERFVKSGWQFGGEADATAKAAKKGAAVAKEGAIDTGGNAFEIYQMTETGFALQATVAGTKYWKDKKLNR